MAETLHWEGVKRKQLFVLFMTDQPWNRTKIVHSPFLKQFFIGISFWCTPPPLPALPIRQCDPLHSHIPGKPQHYKCFNVPPPSTCFRIKRRKELGTPSKQYNLLINELNQRYFFCSFTGFKKRTPPLFLYVCVKQHGTNKYIVTISCQPCLKGISRSFHWTKERRRNLSTSFLTVQGAP